MSDQDKKNVQQNNSAYFRNQVDAYKNSIDILTMTIIYKKHKIAYLTEKSYDAITIEPHQNELYKMEDEMKHYKTTLEHYENELKNFDENL
jgi:hypothetical protein